ncbi:MAG: AAA family ATPase [Thermoanaerobaculia bacterium]
MRLVAGAVIRARSRGIGGSAPPDQLVHLPGPTSVAWNIARNLARGMFDEENMVRIRHEQYMSRHAVSRLIGAPPGYVGYEEGGQLTEAVRHKAYSVVLLTRSKKRTTTRSCCADPGRRTSHRAPRAARWTSRTR